METLRSGHSARIYGAWRGAGLFDLAFPEVGGRIEENVRTLEMVDAGVAQGESLSDPVLIGSLFLQRFYRDFTELSRNGARLDNVEMLKRLSVMLEPAATELRLANHTLHLMAQGLFTLTKMHRAPERGRQVLKLARRDYFDVAWGLYDLAAAVGLVPKNAFLAWSTAVDRLRKGNQSVLKDEQPAKRKRRRRPRRRRRR
jgi:hypothetical protein